MSQPAPAPQANPKSNPKMTPIDDIAAQFISKKKSRPKRNPRTKRKRSSTPKMTPIDDIASQFASQKKSRSKPIKNAKPKPAPSMTPIDDIAIQMSPPASPPTNPQTQPQPNAAQPAQPAPQAQSAQPDPKPVAQPKPTFSPSKSQQGNTGDKQATIDKLQEEVAFLEKTRLKEEESEFEKIKATLPPPDPPPVPAPPPGTPPGKTPVGGPLKEQKDAHAGGGSSPEHAPVLEKGVEFEAPAEVQPWVEAKPDPVISTIPTPVKDEFGEILLEASNVSRPNIVLPMEEQEIKKALHHRVADSVRWLGEWCKRVIKVYPKRTSFNKKEEKNPPKQPNKPQLKADANPAQPAQPQPAQPQASPAGAQPQPQAKSTTPAQPVPNQPTQPQPASPNTNLPN